MLTQRSSSWFSKRGLLLYNLKPFLDWNCCQLSYSRSSSTVAEGLSSTLPRITLRCYTDSQVALFWIQGVEAFCQQQSERDSPEGSSNHRPGITNPADVLTRGLTPLELSVSRLWTMGPKWLQSGFEPSPPTRVHSMPEECAVELRVKQSHTLVSTKPHVSLGLILDPTRFSTLSRLIRVTATTLRAVKKFKYLRSKKTEPPLSATEELQEAELLWLKSAQGTNHGSEDTRDAVQYVQG